ncbi:MAG TPA: glycosyl hydrolase [Solirubrobacteraceae bacterium]|nr:glycosyl hydrolase [Solirubrobacteraceae bacterium]
MAARTLRVFLGDARTIQTTPARHSSTGSTAAQRLLGAVDVIAVLRLKRALRWACAGLCAAVVLSYSAPPTLASAVRNGHLRARASALAAGSAHDRASLRFGSALRNGSVSPYAGRVGMSMSHDLVTLPTSQIQAEFAQLRAGGVSWAREDLAWAIAEPKDGVYNWTPFDHLMTAASLAGVKVLGILDYSAPWASSDPSGRGNMFYPPKNDADFATYAAAVVARYGTNGSFWAQNPQLTRDPLAAVQVWGEPYGSWRWMPGPDPVAYAQLVRQTALAVHAADPALQVLMAGDLNSWSEHGNPHSQPWLAQVLAADPSLPGLVNGLSVDPYPTPRNLGPYGSAVDPAQSFSEVPLVHQTEAQAGVRLPIWITEIGWSTAPDTQAAVSDATQATFMRQAIQRGIGDWGSYVSKIFVFGWYRSSGVSGDWENNLGLLGPNGAPKPAWGAITQLLRGSGAATLQGCPSCPAAT